MKSIRTGSSALRWSLLGAAIALVVMTAVVWWLSIRPDASKVQLEDPVSVVTEILGEYTAEYRSKSEIEASKFAHFEFMSLTDTSAPKIRASGLPEVVGRALWFPFLTTAGTLVYLDASNLVTAVFSAGT